MQEREIDLEIPLLGEQWAQLEHTAEELGPDEGFDRDEEEHEITLLLRAEDAQGLWEGQVSDPESYGRSGKPVAAFSFNDGRPVARLLPPESLQQPVVSTEELEGMDEGLDRWVRNRWQFLLRESGLHFERGHIPHD